MAAHSSLAVVTLKGNKYRIKNWPNLRFKVSSYLIALIRVRQLSVWRHHIGEVQTSHLPAPIRARVRVVLTNQEASIT